MEILPDMTVVTYRPNMGSYLGWENTWVETEKGRRSRIPGEVRRIVEIHTQLPLCDFVAAPGDTDPMDEDDDRTRRARTRTNQDLQDEGRMTYRKRTD